MQSIVQGNYTRQQIDDVLHGRYGPRVIKFRYDLLDKNEAFKKTLDTVQPGTEIQMSKDSEIKRIAKFNILDDGSIDWLNDRIQPFFLLKMPGDNWIEWPLGIFLLPSPKRKDDHNKVYREIEAYDGNLILQQDKFSYAPYFAAGTKYIDAIKQILAGAGITKINIEDSSEALQTDREWDIGTSRLTVINSLLKEIAYTDIWVDERGYFTASKYVSPSIRAEEYLYKDDDLSIIYPEVEEDCEIFNVPNQWTVTATNSETAPLSSTYTNDNPNSPTSTVNRGRTISADPVTIDYVASQSALNDYVKMIADKDNQVNGEIDFNTALMPMHSFDDVLRLEYSPLNIANKYEELGWTMVLKKGEKMKHQLRKVVQV